MVQSQEQQRVAVLYQATKPPVIDGIRKPMKPSGYKDSGADIVYALHQAGIAVATPVAQPDPLLDSEWVFPDTPEGIQQAIAAGATTLWANTILFKGHALEDALSDGIKVVGQRPEQVHAFDDKWHANETLRAAGCPIAHSVLVSNQDVAGALALDTLTEAKMAEHGIGFPAVLKPLRGRGSQGVTKVNTLETLKATGKQLLSETVVMEGAEYLKYGDSLILEEYLPSTEVTVTVMPPGTYVINGAEVVKAHHWALPPVERFNHVDGVTPYNGVVAVMQNSRALTESDRALQILEHYCAVGAYLVGAVAPIRVDCRAVADGTYRMFDLNMKPNMTGAGRPGRDDQDSLSCMAARVIGWSYEDLLRNMLRQAWQASSLPNLSPPQMPENI